MPHCVVIWYQKLNDLSGKDHLFLFQLHFDEEDCAWSNFPIKLSKCRDKFAVTETRFSVRNESVFNRQSPNYEFVHLLPLFCVVKKI